MQIQTSIGSAVGNNSSIHWAQTIKTPIACGLVEAIDDAGIAQTIGMQAIGKITQALEHAPVSLREVEQIANEGMHEGIRSIVLVVPMGAVFYIAICGKGMVYLKRSGQYARLLDHEGSISGQANVGDILILSSSGLANTIEEKELISLIESSSIESADAVAMLLNKQSDSAGCAAMIVEVDAIVSSEVVHQEIEPKHNAPVGVFIERFRSYTKGGKIHRFVQAPRQDKIATMKRHFLLWRHRFNNPKISITMILLVCFGLSIIFGVQRELSTKQNKQITAVMTEATRMYEEGVALMELNSVKGRERLVSAKTLLAPLQEQVTNKTKEGRRVLELYDQISQTLIQAMHAYVREPQLFYDASLLKSDGVVSAITLENDMLVLADTKEKAVYSITLPSKTGSIIGGGVGYETQRFVALHGTTAYTLLSDGITTIDFAQKKTKQNVIKRSDEWGLIASMVSFGGNIYLLDTSKSRVWKYVASENGFSDIREYLNPDTLPDLSKCTSMVIDGSVWMGTTDGKILRFTQGKENVFVPKGVDPAFGNTLVVYTSDEVKNIYVLDGTQKRVVVLDKDGIYLAQYTWGSDIPFTHLVVSEKHGKILLLGGDKVYSISLQ